MEEIIIAVLVKIAEVIVVPVGRWLCYSCHYKSNMENLKNQEIVLRGANDRVKNKVQTALNNGDEIHDDVKMWLSKVDDIIYQLATKKLGGGEEAESRNSNASSLNLKQRQQISREAKKMVGNIAELLKKKPNLLNGVSYRSLASEEMVTPRNVEYMTLDSRILITKRIMEVLGDANINMIGVWGLPGVGKSTLMKEIFRKAKEESLFDEVALAIVTDSPNLSRIQGEIADMLDLKLDPNCKTEMVRAGHLRAGLEKDKEKKILVILDDIWRRLDLEEIGITPSERCKVLLTSRDRRVLASNMGTEENIFELDILGQDEAWNLFEKMAGDSVKHDHDLRNTAIDVAKACGGFPIALVTVSRALKNKHCIIWKDALVQLTRPTPEDDTDIWLPVYSCIQLSYKRLVDSELKSLFLLCAQQDYNISYRDLLRYGFGLRLFHGIDTLNEARNRLENLVSDLQDASLLLQSPRRFDEFYMHDFVRHVATIIGSSDHNMFVMRGDGGQRAWPDVDKLKRCEALSFHGGDHIHQYPNKLECPKLRYFHVQCTDESLEIPNIFLQGMDKLEVLSLTNIQLSSLLPLTNLQTLCLDGCKLGDIHWIGELKTLVILSLARSGISNLPREIGSLSRLRLLDLTDCFELRVIPPNVLSSLVKLEELYMRNIDVEWEVEGPINEGKNASLAELKKLSHLITLEIKILDANNLPKDLFSKKLERYKISIGGSQDGYLIFPKAAFSRMLELELNMSSFQLDFGIKMLLKSTEYLYLDELNSTKSVLYELDREELQQLKHLHIQNNDNIMHLPEWTSFKNLKVLKVGNCEKLRFIFSSSIARGLSLLEELKITRCNNMGAIFGKEEDHGIEEVGDMMLFRRLETLVLKDLPKLVSFLCTRETNSQGNHDLQVPLLHHQLSFPSLKKLHLQNLAKIKHVWSDINGCERLKSLEQLESLEIGDCGELEEIVQSEDGVLEEIVQSEDGIDLTTRPLFPSLTLLSLDNLPKLKRFFQGVSTLKSSSSKELLHEQGGTLFGPEEVAFPNLTKMCLCRLPKIKHVWSKDPRIVTSQECVSLKQLKKIFIEDCGVEEIIGTKGGDAVGRTVVLEFPQVTSLDLANLPRLECFYKGVHISKWPMLERMSIKRCKKVEVFASGLVSFEKTVEERQYSQMSIKQPLFLVDEMSFPSLETLDISKLEKLEIIWYGVVAASLTTLNISDCGSLEAVFEQHEGQNGKESHALTATQRLRKMYLGSLPKLRNIWNIKDSHQRHMYSFPNLLYIDVSLCESLKSLFPATLVAASPLQLQSIMITGCEVMEEIVAIEDGTDPTRLSFPSLICLGLYGLPKLKSFYQVVRTLESSSSRELHELGGTLFVVEEVAFPNLKLLDLYGLPKIKHIWSKDSHTIPSFQNLQVIIAGNCVSLKSMFPASIVRCLEHLEKIKIYDCGVEEIVAAEGGEAVEMMLVFPQVTSLCLENLQRLECFYKGVHDSKWSMLNQTRILQCEKVKLSFPSLVTLEIRRMYRLEIMSRNVTIGKLWRSCYARCLHANESYRLKQAFVPDAMDYELLKMVDISLH